jgi:hypothetical protein
MRASIIDFWVLKSAVLLILSSFLFYSSLSSFVSSFVFSFHYFTILQKVTTIAILLHIREVMASNKARSGDRLS